MSHLRIVAAAALVVSGGIFLHANEVFAADVPSSVDPAKIDNQLKLKPESPKISAGGAVSGSDSNRDTPIGASSFKFKMQSIKLEGSSVFDDLEIQERFASLLGNDVTVAEIYQAAADLTAAYRNKGFILSSVIVPPQKIDRGNVRLQAVEGYIDRVKVEGFDDLQRDAILVLLANVVGVIPLNATTLERYLLLAGDLPGVSVKSFIRPSSDNSGAAILDVKGRHKFFSTAASVDNRGSEFIGPYNANASVSLNGIGTAGTAINGRVIFTPVNPSELRYGNLVLTQELDSNGTGLQFSISGLESSPGGALTALDLKSQSLSADLTVRSKVIRTRGENLTLSAGVSFQNAYTNSLSARLSEDNSRTVRVGAVYQFLDAFFGANMASLTLHQGLGIVGGTAKGSALLTRADADPAATWVTASASRVQRLTPSLSASLSVSGQYSLKPQTASREFSVGGRANGSAFDSSEISGDQGISGRIELAYAFDMGDMPDDLRAYADLSGGQIYMFGDGGAVWQHSDSSGGQVDDALASAGIGLRLNLSSFASVEVELAQPVVRQVDAEGDKKPRVFVNLLGRF